MTHGDAHGVAFDTLVGGSDNDWLLMTEPDVAITDYLLTIESWWLATWLVSEPSPHPQLQFWFAVFFVATGVAAALGGTVHGFFQANPSAMGTFLWRASLTSIGIVAGAAWMIASMLLWSDHYAGTIVTVLALALIVYAVVIFAINDAFWVAIVAYLPSTVLLIVAYGWRYRATGDTALAIGLGGLGLTLVAAVGQRLRIGFHPVYFNHNAVYHAVQAVALFMIFWSGLYLVHA